MTGRCRVGQRDVGRIAAHLVAVLAGIWSNGLVTPDPVDRLLTALQLEEVSPDTFRGQTLPYPSNRVFGGQVLAQALLAAGRTVPGDRPPHSMHGYFLRPGDLAQPIMLPVERLRDGRSFTARRTHAVQGDEPIFSMIASFQKVEAGLEHQIAAPSVAAPEAGIDITELLAAQGHPAAAFWANDSAFEIRQLPDFASDPAQITLDQQAVWVRCRGQVPDDPLLHAALLAYSCDHVMLQPVLRQHGLTWASPGMSVASLDHAMWWHHPARVDQWLLHVQGSPASQGGRGLGTARVYNRDGLLVASMAQEGMVRIPS